MHIFEGRLIDFHVDKHAKSYVTSIRTLRKINGTRLEPRYRPLQPSLSQQRSIISKQISANANANVHARICDTREERQRSRREKESEGGERERRVTFASRLAIWPRNVGTSRTCPAKQPNSPHVDFTKREGQREREKRRKSTIRTERGGGRKRGTNERPILEVSPGESLDGAVPRRLDKGLMCPKFIREFGPHRYRYRRCPRIVWRE